MKWILASLILGATALTGPARADVYALLVGVSDYRYLDADLRGPANDPGLIAAALQARGAVNITVLAAPDAPLPDGLVPAGEPTRAAILSHIAELADQVGPGDTAFFYFSGHGAQAPDMNGDEAGGYDEIFLPSDAKNWKGTIGAVENSIIDDEFQPLFQAILDTGATLVGVLDACHSGTGFRAIGAGLGVERFLSADALGMPAPIAPTPVTEAPPPLSGDFAFLYAAQSDQRAFEFPFGEAADPANWHGDFTRALALILTEVSDLSWEQALRAASDDMRGTDSAVQTPDGEGTALHAPVFGSTTPGAARVGFSDGVLAAGVLAGLSDGALIDIYAGATGGEVLGQARLRDVGAQNARLVPESGVLPEIGYGVQVQPGTPAPFALAAPVIADGGDYALLIEEMAALAAAGLPEGIHWNAANPDAVPVLTDGTLALTGVDGVLDPSGPGSSPRVDGALGLFIERAARVHRLRAALALAASQKGTARGFGAIGLGVTATREAGVMAEGACDVAGAEQPFDPAQPLHTCDRLWLSLANTSTTARDVTVLYVDRAYNITALWPEPGLSNRIAFGETQEVGLEIRTPDGLPGLEELIVIAAPARPGQARLVLTGLADAGALRAGPDASALAQYLFAAADPGVTTRALGAVGVMAPLDLTRLRLTIQPQAF